MKLKYKILAKLPKSFKKNMKHLFLKEDKSKTEFNYSRFKRKELKEAIKMTFSEIKKKFPQKQAYIISNFNLDFKLPYKLIRNFENVDIPGNVFIPIFSDDGEYTKIIKKIKSSKGIFFSPELHIPPAKYFHENKACRKALSQTFKDLKEFNLTHFDKNDFENIAQAIEMTKDVEGNYVEIGVFEGTSGCMALNYLKESSIKRKCYFLDTYSGFDYEEAKESFDGYWSGTHNLGKSSRLMERIEKIFSKKGIAFKLVKSNICSDSLPKEIKKIAVCNIDVDMYDAVAASLKKVSNLISPNGVMILEDFGHTPLLGGANLAVREFLSSKEGKKFISIYMASGQYFLIRKNKIK